MCAGKTWRRRLGCAFVLVLAPLIILALSEAAVEAVPFATPGKLKADVGLRAAREAPSWFVEEVADVDGREELRANDEWSVVSFIEEGDGALADRLVGELEERGWTL